MSNIDKRAVQAVVDLKAGYTLGHADVAILNELARIALASLEAEPVGEVVLGEYDDCGCHPDARVACIAADGQADWENFKDGTRLYTAPPAPVSVPDEEQCKPHQVMAVKGELGFLDHFDRIISERDEDIDIGQLGSSNYESLMLAALDAFRASKSNGADSELQSKAAIHDGLCEKYNVESLVAFVDWQRNHIAELEAAPPAPVGPGEAAVMPDYPGHTMTQRECFQAGKKAGLAEAVTTAYKLRDAVETIRNSGIAIDAEKILAERDALNAPDCWCRTCRPITLTDMRFVVCPECGNKRCPHANDHRHACTGSNEPGQEGSAYPAAPQQEVK